MNSSGLRAVVSNTGPLISALQCGHIDILRQFYDVIHIPASELPEYEKHGAGGDPLRAPVCCTISSGRGAPTDVLRTIVIMATCCSSEGALAQKVT